MTKTAVNAAPMDRRVLKSPRAVLAFQAGLLLALLPGCGGPLLERVPGSGEVVGLKVGGNVIHAEVALDDPSRHRGLMFRKELPEDHGMLFVWPGPRKQGFYMRNTSIPLSIAFIDDEGKILQIEDLKPHDELTKTSKDEVRYALEVNQGWFRKKGLGPGAVFDGFRERVGRLDAR